MQADGPIELRRMYESFYMKFHGVHPPAPTDWSDKEPDGNRKVDTAGRGDVGEERKMKPKSRILDTYWRAQAERFWHTQFLEYLIEDLRFSSETAAIIVHMALQKRRVMAYAGS